MLGNLIVYRHIHRVIIMTICRSIATYANVFLLMYIIPIKQSIYNR